MNAGYSSKSLSEKLGIKQNYKICIICEDLNFLKRLQPLPKGVLTHTTLNNQYNLVHYFTNQKADLEKIFIKLKSSILNDGMLWISWPKGSSKIKTDLNENIIRDIGLKNGMVDVKVIAVDNIWSGLKFVYRLKDRK